MFPPDQAAAMAVKEDFRCTRRMTRRSGASGGRGGGEIGGRNNASWEDPAGKARIGCMNRQVDLVAIGDRFGTRANAMVAQEINDKGITLIRTAQRCRSPPARRERSTCRC
jgi:hypothetical protein